LLDRRLHVCSSAQEGLLCRPARLESNKQIAMQHRVQVQCGTQPQQLECTGSVLCKCVGCHTTVALGRDSLRGVNCSMLVCIPMLLQGCACELVCGRNAALFAKCVLRGACDPAFAQQQRQLARNGCSRSCMSCCGMLTVVAMVSVQWLARYTLCLRIASGV
jgi:hypothetical protein